MADRLTALGFQGLAEIAEYHNDIVDAVRFYWQPRYQQNDPRFVGCTPTDFATKLETLRLDRIRETEMRSIFALLASVEAAIRVDYKLRATQKRKDNLSKSFRLLYRKQENQVRLDEDLLDLWTKHHPELKRYVSELRAALKFRHWLAHGRYWQQPTNGRFDYETIYDLAEAILNFPLYTN